MIHNIMNIAEYKHETVSGQGSVSWDDGIKCYIPSVKVTGKAEQGMPTPQVPSYPTFTAPKLDSHGKNLFDISDVTIAFKSNGTTVSSSPSYPYQIHPNGEIEIGVSSSYNGLYWGDSGIYLPAGIYTVSADLFIPSTSTSTIYNFGVRNFDENTSFLQRFTDNKTDEWFRAIYTFSATNGVYRFLAQIVGGSSYTDVCVRVKNIQIEKNNIYTGFEKYFSGGTVQCPILYATLDGEFANIYDTQSGIFLHDMDKVELTGRESITASTAYGNGVKISGVFNGYVAGGGRIGLCSHALVGNDKDMHFGSITKAVFWHNVLDDLGMTLDDFKAWLTNQYELGSPVTIWYPLSNPTETTVQMPEKLKMSKGSGRIIQTDSGLVADIEAKVLKHS